jgi:hypothetical protein
MRAIVAMFALAAVAGTAHADPDPKRKVCVLEYRSGSSALPGVARRLIDEMSKQTSLQLLGPDQALTVYGDQLDQALVKCAGDAECIAQIGRKVGVAEVILVGISELGDVILTMQRIDANAKTVVTRVADSLAAKASPSDDQINGYLARLLAPGDFLRYGVIDIVANLAGASVTVGGENRGLTPIQSLKLHAPATYTIRVEKTDYVPFTTKVALPPDGEIKVEAELSKRGTGGAWYQHWYVLAGAGILVAGAAGTAIYFGTRDATSDRVPVTIVIP